jgi:hypothetical protein
VATGRHLREIRTAQDADTLRHDIAEVFDGWFAFVPSIDWDDFLERLESRGDYDLGSDMNSPAIRRIKQIVRSLRSLSE